MRTCSKTVFTALCLASFLIFAGSAVAQRVTTNTTFSRPVQLPGLLLQAGAYEFSLIRDGRTVVVAGADHRILGTFAVSPITRAKPGEIIILRPSAAGAAPEVAALYSNGGTSGVEFVRRAAGK